MALLLLVLELLPPPSPPPAGRRVVHGQSYAGEAAPGSPAFLPSSPPSCGEVSPQTPEHVQSACKGCRASKPQHTPGIIHSPTPLFRKDASEHGQRGS